MSDQKIMNLYQAALKENIELKEQIYSLEEIMKTNELQMIATENHFNAVIETKDVCIRELKKMLAHEEDAKKQLKVELGYLHGTLFLSNLAMLDSTM